MNQTLGIKLESPNTDITTWPSLPAVHFTSSLWYLEPGGQYSLSSPSPLSPSPSLFSPRSLPLSSPGRDTKGPVRQSNQELPWMAGAYISPSIPRYLCRQNSSPRYDWGGSAGRNRRPSKEREAFRNAGERSRVWLWKLCCMFIELHASLTSFYSNFNERPLSAYCC